MQGHNRSQTCQQKIFEIEDHLIESVKSF